MKALLTDNNGRLWLDDIALPEIGEYDCLVRIEACAFCHSTDRHIVEGTFMSKFTDPSILGHESIGVVERTGAGVRHLTPGDRVLRAYALYPGETRDGIGSAWGGFAEFAKVRDWQAMVDDGRLAADSVPNGFRYMQKIPADIPFERTLLMITQKEIYSATAQIDPIEGGRFLIAGAGITACFFGIFLKRRGAGRVTMAARREAPLAFARGQGLVDDVHLLDESASPDGTYDGLVETTGSLSVAESLAESALRDSGALYSYAVYPGMRQEGFFDGLAAKRRFVRINPAEATAHGAVVDLLRAGELDPAPFVTARFGIDEWEAAWRTVIEKTSLKTAIVF